MLKETNIIQSLESEIERLKRRVAREQSKRKALEDFAESKTRELFEEKNKVDLISRVIKVTSRSEKLIDAVEQVSTILLDFNLIDGFHLVERRGAKNTILYKNSGQQPDALEQIDFSREYWVSNVFSEDCESGLVAQSIENHYNVDHWVIKLHSNDKIFCIFNFISKKKFNEIEEEVLFQIKQQLALVHSRESDASLIHQISHYDQLTKLYTKNAFTTKLGDVIERQRQYQTEVAVVTLNIAQMHLINSELSVGVGNQLIRHIATQLKKILRNQDCLARHSGDGFVFYLIANGARAAIDRILQNINSMFEKKINWNDTDIKIAFHIGFTIERAADVNAEQLIEHAEIALKKAKQDQVSPIEFTETLVNKAKSEKALYQDLEQALKNQDFILHYQPIVNLQSNKIVKAEALIRWRKNGQLIPPFEFISYLEASDLIIPVGRWIIKQAISDLSHWIKMNTSITQISVNLSVRQFNDKSLVEWIDSLMSAHGLANEALVIEVTESMSLETDESMKEVLDKFNQRGIKISLDDFGTGYSSLSYLHRYPFNILKIDRAFIVNLTLGKKNYNLLKSIVALSRSLELDSVAEGIETQEVSDLAKSLGVLYGQGYFYSKPVDAADFAALLKSYPG